MNINAYLVNTIVDEVEQYLTVSSVGAYEVLWISRTSAPESPDEHVHAHAVAALKELRRRGQEFVWLVWPNERPNIPVRDAPLDDPNILNDPVENVPYLAVKAPH